MCERIFDKVLQLHYDTLDSEINTVRDRTLVALSSRLYRSDQYGKKVSSGVRKDVTALVLLVAYIMGSREISFRKQSKMAQLDLSLPNDEKFYRGIWDLLCELFAPDGAIISPLPIVEEHKIHALGDDPDVYAFNIKEIAEQYVAYCILNDEPCKSRSAASRLFNLPTSWISIHYMMIEFDQRTLPIGKLLNFMFGMFRLDYLCKPAPSSTFWNEHAYNAWNTLHWMIRDELAASEVYRAKATKADTGNYTVSKKTK